MTARSYVRIGNLGAGARTRKQGSTEGWRSLEAAASKRWLAGGGWPPHFGRRYASVSWSTRQSCGDRSGRQRSRVVAYLNHLEASTFENFTSHTASAGTRRQWAISCLCQRE